MQKNGIEPFKNEYVKLIKNNNEVLEGIIVDILDDAIIFQTELKRYGVAMDSVKNIISIKEGIKKENQGTSVKI